MNDSELPPLLKDVDEATIAKREVAAFLFDQAIERALNWFDGVECSAAMIVRAVNYVVGQFDTI